MVAVVELHSESDEIQCLTMKLQDLYDATLHSLPACVQIVKNFDGLLQIMLPCKITYLVSKQDNI